MKKEIFITATIIMIIGGFLTKLLGLVIRIVVTRLIGLEGIGLYMLILPTFNLFIILAQLGVPIAISKLVAEDSKNNRKLIFSILPVIMILNIIIMVGIYFFTPILAEYLLNNPALKYPLYSIAIVLPFITISNVVRGYFFGKQQMFPHVLSNVFEQIVRIIAIIIIVPLLYQRGIEYAVSGVVLVNIASELMSIIILVGYLPKKIKIRKEHFKPDREYIKDIFGIGIPTTGSRIIGSVNYFLEPIILTQVLLYIGYTSHYITTEYGILSGYALPLLMLPSFFSQAISSVLVPVISKSYVANNIRYIKKKLKQAILILLAIGFIATLCLMLEPLFFLKFIYNTSEGVIYLRILAPIFLIHYMQQPLSSALLAMNRAKTMMFNTLVGAIVRSITLFIASLFHIGLYGLVLAITVGIIINTVLDYRSVKKVLATSLS